MLKARHSLSRPDRRHVEKSVQQDPGRLARRSAIPDDPRLLVGAQRGRNQFCTAEARRLRLQPGPLQVNGACSFASTGQAAPSRRSPCHPALGQYGLFASDHLTPGRIVVEYLGYVHSRRDVDSLSDYDLSLDRDRGIGIDAARMGNEARFINDYRGVRDSPNVEFVDLLVRGERRVGVRVLPVGKSGKGKKGIGKGEELLVNYGKGFWQSRSKEVAAKGQPAG